MIGFPYPKFMNAIIDVDQAAALLLTDTETARALGIPPEQWVYLRRLRRRDRPLVRQRPRRLLELAGHPRRRRAGARAGAPRRSTRSTASTSTAASRAPCRSRADMLGIARRRPAAAHRHRRPALPRRAGQQLQSRTRIASMVERLRATPGTPRAGHRRRLVPDQARGRRLPSAPPAHAFAREDPARYQAAHRRRAASRAGRRSRRRRRPSRPTPSRTTATAARRSASSSPASTTGAAAGPTLTDPDVLERMEREEFIGHRGQVRHHAPTQTNEFEP